MNRNELLEFMKGKVSDYYYDVLVAWTKKRERKFFGLLETKFDIKPLHIYNGYCIYGTSAFDWINIYPK